MITPSQCWDELEPVCLQIARLISSAPLAAPEKTGLALLYLTHSITVAAGEQSAWKGGSLEANARSIVDLALAAAFPPQPPALKIVSENGHD